MDNGGTSEGPLASAAYPASGTVVAAPVVNTPPTASDGTVTPNEDTDHTFAAANFSYADSEGDPLASVKITGLPAAGELTLDGTAIADTDLPKTVPAADLTADKLKYSPPADANGTGYASFTFKVNDGTSDSAAEYTMTINVNTVDDPATGAPAISGTAQVGQTLTASTAGIADLDGLPGTFTYQWERYAANGTTFEADIGTNATYTLSASEEGKKVQVEVSFVDNGGTSEGPLASAAYPASGTVEAAPVNDPPTAAHGTVTTNEDTDHTFTANDFDYLDSDGDALASVKITGLPAAGELTLDGTAIADTDLPKTVAAADLTASKLKYTPPANANGTGYASFTFKVNDGTSDSASTYTMTINVTAVNDPATGAPTISGTAQVGQTLTASAAGIADLDGLPGTFTYQWKRYASDGTTFEANIGTNATYRLSASEEGKKVKVEVSFVDNGGTSEGPLASAAYPASGTVLQLMVSFGQAAYTAAEGGTATIAVMLNADPERMVVIPLTAMNQGGASLADYSVPASVTFDAGDTSKTITFSAIEDMEDDDGESVLLAFGTLPGGVSAGTTNQATVSITVTPRPSSVSPPSGGGGGGGGGPSPSVIDFEWTVSRDIEDLGGGHDKPSGTWSDGATLWVLENGDGADDAIYAYDLKTGERVEDREFELDETNRAPRSVWSDRTVLWVSDSGQEKLFAHDLATGERLPERDIALADRNRDARGIWSDDGTMWVLDGGKESLFGYDLVSGESLAEYALDDANDDPRGLFFDGVTFWVSDHGEKRIFAYRLKAGEDDEDALERNRDEEFPSTVLSRAGNNSPRGLWSDGDVMYVADESDAKVYTYNMPDAIDARLASLTLSGVDFGEFSPLRYDYASDTIPDGNIATLTAIPAQPGASLQVDPEDHDGDLANGRQVRLLPGLEITITVTSPDGSRERVYRVRLAPEEVAEPAPEEAAEVAAGCLRGAVAVGFSLVVYARGSIEDLVACAQSRNVTALYTLDDGQYVSYIVAAPELVNRSFAGLFADGVPALTPLIATSDGPATAAAVASAVTGPWAACLQREIVEGFNLVVYEGGSVGELEACAERVGLAALYVLDDGVWVSYIVGAPEFVNRSFRELFTDGLPVATPLVGKRD